MLTLAEMFLQAEEEFPECTTLVRSTTPSRALRGKYFANVIHERSSALVATYPAYGPTPAIALQAAMDLARVSMKLHA